MAQPEFRGDCTPEHGKLRANYHTHTFRCHHAQGTEREYIENALEVGMTTLGFADHSPYVFEGDFYSGYRMRPGEIAGYVDTLLALREEYRGRIDILIGFEAEYYPKHFEQFLQLIEPYPIDYLILGQHFLHNEYDDERHTASEHGDESELELYVEQVIEGLNTGRFSYLAHPDVFHFTGDDAVYVRHMRRLCEAAKALSVPLEFNFYGFDDHRFYPTEKFFRIAAEVGNEVIFGCDAHFADMMLKTYLTDRATEIMDRLGLRRTEQIRLTLRK